jgi:hypothetical protein
MLPDYLAENQKRNQSNQRAGGSRLVSVVRKFAQFVLNAASCCRIALRSAGYTSGYTCPIILDHFTTLSIKWLGSDYLQFRFRHFRLPVIEKVKKAIHTQFHVTVESKWKITPPELSGKFAG